MFTPPQRLLELAATIKIGEGIMKDKDIHTDIVLDATNCPFATMTMSKIPNVWYHNNTDKLFSLSKLGFRQLKIGSKKALIKNKLI